MAGTRRSLGNVVTSVLVAVVVALAAVGAACLTGCSAAGDATSSATSAVATSEKSGATSGAATVSVAEDGSYTSKDDVALYIHAYGHLPSNYISKTKARAAGWVSSEGNLDEVLPGKSIGGSQYYDDDQQLPAKKGRTWTECDINYTGGYRGAERIVFSNDGLIYYTGDHYQTFERLY